MELLFKKNGAGSTELKALLGFLDADIKIENIWPDLITATNSVIDLIGKEVYDKCVLVYNQEDKTVTENHFIYSVSYPIAINAYMLFAPSNDLSHTNNGRKMRQDDGVKLPFEWMLDKDNDALENRYFRALDDLVKMLDNSKVNPESPTTIYALWTSSDAFKESNLLFIRSVKEFDLIFPIKSRLLLLKLAPGITDCEDYHIKPRITAIKFKEFKDKLKTNVIIDNETDIELLRLIKKACAFSALAWSMMRLSANLYPNGLLQHYTSEKATTRGQKPAAKSETEAARQAFQEDADKALLEIEKLLEPPSVINANISVMPLINFGDKHFST